MGLRSFLFGEKLAAAGGLLGLALVATACDPGGQLRGGGGCPLLDCQSGVTFLAPLSTSSSDLPSLVVRFCRGPVCVDSPLSPAPTGQSGGPAYRCDASGPLPTSCQLTVQSSGMQSAGQLALSFGGRLDDFQDGDPYTVQVATASGALLINRSTSAHYTVTPDPQTGCPAQCRRTSL